MTTPAEWIHMMGQPTPGARHFIAVQVRMYLTAHAAANSTRAYTTQELAEALWPPQHALGEAVALRKRMVDLLLKCAAEELSDCARRGPAKARKFMGKVMRPWLWSCAQMESSGTATVPSSPTATPVMGKPISAIEWPAYKPELTLEEQLAKLTDLIRLVPAQQLLPAAKSQEIARAILDRARVVFKQ